MRWFVGLSLLVASSLCFGASTELVSKELAAPPIIDGVINGDEWSSAAVAEGLVETNTAEPCPYNAKFYVQFDQNYIYFAAEVFDPEPKKIVADEYRPNSSLDGEDRVGMALDLFGTFVDTNYFLMNPRGANSLEIAGGRAAKTEWLGEVLTKSQMSSNGWQCESRIPWQILRLPPEGIRNVRINFYRYLPRTQRNYTWRYTNNGQEENAGTWLNVTIPKTDNTRQIQLLTYGLAGVQGNKTLLNSGVDFRTRLSDQVEAVGTLNPDFRNIEQSILSLDFSYFERLTDDSRPFFQEGSGFFRTGFGSKVFVSNRIDSFDFGTRVYGKLDNDTKFGVMNVTTFQKENAFVTTASRSLSSRSNVDFAYARLDRDNLHNDALFSNLGYGTGSYFFYAGAMATADSKIGDGLRTTFGFEHSTKRTSASLDYTGVEKNYLPRLGFVNDRDSKGFSGYYEWDQYHPRGTFSESGIGAFATKLWRYNGDNYRQEVGMFSSLTFRNDIDIDSSFSKSRFEQFDDEIYNVNIEWPRRARTRSWEASFTNGRLAGDRYSSIRLSSKLKPLRTLDVALQTQFVDHTDRSTQWIGSFNWDLLNNKSLSGRVVRQDNDWNGYISFRQSGGRGNEYFFIIGDPNARTFRTSVVLKAVVPVTIKF